MEAIDRYVASPSSRSLALPLSDGKTETTELPKESQVIQLRPVDPLLTLPPLTTHLPLSLLHQAPISPTNIGRLPKANEKALAGTGGASDDT
jgi:hypothetical protein